MAEDNVGGISVSFTADAAQLQAEIQRLEAQLKRFDASYGKQQVHLQLAAPSRRNMLDTRREIAQAFTARGSAGQIMAKVAVEPPNARALQGFKAQLGRDIGTIPIRVIGNFEWGQKPPTSITVPVTPAGGGGGTARAAQTTALAGQRPAQARAAAPAPAPTRGGRPPSSSTARAAAQVQTVSGRQFFADWSDQDILADFLEGGGNAAYRNRLRDELKRRGFDPDAAARPTARPAARGLTGGMTAAYGYGAPQVRHHGSTGQFPRSRSLGVSQPIRDIYDPYAGGPKPGQIGVSDLPGLSQRRLENQLRRVMSRVTPEAMEAGTGWYQRAGQLVQGIGSGTGRGRMQIAAAAANFSQNASWPENLRNAQDFFTAFKRGARTVEEVDAEVAKIRKGLKTASGTPMQGLGMTARTQRSLDLMQAGGAADIQKIFSSSPKLMAFWKALMGDPTSFTVDRHQALMMSGRTVAGDQRVHEPFQRAGRKVAAELGITPADLQAITWVMALGHEIAGADPQAILQKTGGARGFASFDPYANWQRQEGRAASRRMLEAKNPYGMPQLERFTSLSRTESPERQLINRLLYNPGRTGGARGFSNDDPFNDFDPYGRQKARQPQTAFMQGRAMGTVPGIGGPFDVQRQMEDAARHSRLITQMQQRLSAGGGFTVDPRTGQFLEPQKGRQGPFLAATGTSVSGTDLERLMQQLRANPENARQLAAGGLIGGWQNPRTGQIDLDVSRAYRTKRQMLADLAARPDQEAGFALGAGQDIPNPAYRAASNLTQAQIEQRRAAGRSSYAKLVAEGRAGPGIRGILPRGARVIRQQPAMAMAADLPWDEEGRLPGDEGYGTHARAYGLMSVEEAALDAPVAGGKRPPRGGKVLPGGFQRRARVSPAARAETIQFDANLQEAQRAQEQFQERQIRTARASSIRSVPTFLAGILAGGLGGVSAQEQSKQATQAVNAHRSALKQLTDAQTEENEIAKRLDIEKPGTEAHKALTSSLEEARIKVKDLTAAEKDLRVQADEMTRTANKAAGTGLRNLAAGFASNLVAGLAFGAGFTAIQGAIEGISQGLAPAIGRLTDFSEVAGQTSKTLAETTRQAHGFADVGLAQTFAQAGVKGPLAAQIGPELLQIAQIQAGLSAFRDQQQLIQTAFNFRNAQGIPGITASTGGGLFGIGAEKGLIENIKEQIQTFTPETGGNRRNQIRSEADLQVQREKNAKTLEVVNQQLSLFGISLEQAADTATGRQQVEAQRAAIAQLPGPQAAQFAEVLAQRQLTLTDRQGKLLTGDELQEAVINGLKDMPKQSAAELVKAMRPQIEAQRALFRLQSDFQRDQLDPAQFALQLAAQPLTRQGGFGERPRNALTGQRIPIPPLFRGAFGQEGGAVGAQFNTAFESLGPLLDKTDDRLMELREEGQRALEALVPADQIVQFRALNREITNVGATIAGLQIGVQQEQLNLQVAQYNNQLRIARRSQTDLLQLTGQMGATQGDNLGLLQRQQIMYERQTQELSLQSNELQLQSNTLSIILAQRQINFQRSLAGFVTPGETPQEIAARAREAEIEANFAQKQLDIQKEQLKLAREQQGIATKALPLQFQIQDIGFQRQLADINAEIALLNQGVQVAVNTAAAERAIAHLTALENELVKRAGTYVEEGAKAAGAFMEGVAQVKAATVDGMDTVIRETARAWNIFIRQGVYAVGALTGGSGLPPPSSNYSVRRDTSGEGGGGFQRTTATGFYGMVSGATRITVGEAGPETVAIIRNPRSWTPRAPESGGWGGGGGGNINILVTGNQIGGSEQDQERFAAIIARKVEEIQSRRGSLLGLRSV